MERSALSAEAGDEAFRARLLLAYAGIAAAVNDVRTLSNVVEAEAYHAVDAAVAVLFVWDGGSQSLWCYRYGGGARGFSKLALHSRRCCVLAPFPPPPNR